MPRASFVHSAAEMATGQLALLPDEEVRHVQPATAMHLGAGASANAPVGTLYVTTRYASRRAPEPSSPPLPCAAAKAHTSVARAPSCAPPVRRAPGCASLPQARGVATGWRGLASVRLGAQDLLVRSRNAPQFVASRRSPAPPCAALRFSALP